MQELRGLKVRITANRLTPILPYPECRRGNTEHWLYICQTSLFKHIFIRNAITGKPGKEGLV